MGFLGTRQLPVADQIKMYPNPVRNELTVNTTSEISKVIITNTLGKVVGNTVYSKTINTSNLSKGMYFVTFVNADGTKSTQKLIKD
jgi:phenolic acid decarboxylase